MPRGGALVTVKSVKSSRKGLGFVADCLDAVVRVNPTLDLLDAVLVDVGTSAHGVQGKAREHIDVHYNADNNVV